MKFGRPKAIKKKSLLSQHEDQYYNHFGSLSLEDPSPFASVSPLGPSTETAGDEDTELLAAAMASSRVPGDGLIDLTESSNDLEIPNEIHRGFLPISMDVQRKSAFRSSLSPHDLKVPLSLSPFSVGTVETGALTLSTGIVSQSIRESPFTPLSFFENTARAKTPTLSIGSAAGVTPDGLPRPFSPLTPTISGHNYSSDVSTGRKRTPRATPSPTLGRKSPYKIVDETVKRTRLKTELCMHLQNGRVCPFGDSCTYAHSYEELRKTKLVDLQAAGLIDIETFRTKPCFTWISTGSCPFGRRCSNIHDPRCGSGVTAWLPHTETQGNTMDTDINVDALHQKRSQAILYSNPFGAAFRLDTDGWEDFRKLVCDTSTPKAMKRLGKGSHLTPTQKLDIALKMRGGSEWGFKFQPQHIIYKQPCMVLQERAFIISRKGNMIPIELSNYNQGSPFHLLVREIAFGPDSDPTVRGVAIWFDINPCEIELSSLKEAKRFRWKRDLSNARQQKGSPFDQLDHFNMVRPNDRLAYDLVTDLMKHQHDVLKSEAIENLSLRAARLKELSQEENKLRDRFESMHQDWKRWAWPINKGRTQITKETSVPEAESEYIPETESHGVRPESQTIWCSYVSQVQDSTPLPDTSAPDENKGLAVFRKLRHDLPLSENRSLPHITKRYSWHKGPDGLNDNAERCWKSLLLQSSPGERSEWEIVKQHFESSRSRKTLTILQGKEVSQKHVATN